MNAYAARGTEHAKSVKCLLLVKLFDITQFTSSLYSFLFCAIVCALVIVTFFPSISTDSKSFLSVPIRVVFCPPGSFSTGVSTSLSASFDGAPVGRRHVCPNSVNLCNLHFSDHGLWLVIL